MDIAGFVIKHAVITDGIDFNFFAHDFNLDGFFHPVAFHFNFYGLSGRTFQQVAHIFGVHAFGWFTGNFKENITGTQTGFICREPFVGVCNDNFIAVFANEGANAAVFAGGHKAVVLNVALGYVVGIWVERNQHLVDAFLHQFTRFNFVYIKSI